MTRDAILAALTAEQALICTLSGEAADEPIHGIVAVGCAIRNRVQRDLGGDNRPDWWGEGYKSVCLKHVMKDGRPIGQFTCWWEANSNTARVYALAESLLEGGPHESQTLLAELQWIAQGLIADRLRDHVRGADHYLTADLFRKSPPPWARGRTPVASMGAHLFFRLAS